MASIPHFSKGCQDQQPKSPDNEAPKGTGARIDHPQESLRGFHYSALHAITGYNYLTRKWLPILGPNAYALINVLRSHCFFNPETGEVRDSCFPELETIAREMGVSRSKVCRLLKRDAEGYFIRYDKKTKAWVRWELNRFILVEHRWREMRRQDDQKRVVQTSNRYYVALDDPPTPEDEAKVIEKQQELDALAAMKAAEEAKREERRREAEARNARFSSESQNEMQRGESKRHSEDRPKMTQQKDRTGNAAFTTDFHRSGNEHESAAGAIRNFQPTTSHQTREETEGYETSERITTDADRIEYRKEGKAAARAARPHSKQGEKAATPSERDIALEEANEAAGGVIYSNLVALGDTNAGIGTRVILEALVDVGAPVEVMGALADLGKRRLQRFQYRGGHVENRPGFYTNIMRNLASEAKRKYWDVAGIEKQDQRNHERAIEAAEKKRQEQQLGTRRYL